MKCAICGSENVARSHRKGMERISRYFSLRTPYRCKDCWSRFWVFENPFHNKTAKIALGIVACVAVLLSAWYFWPRKEETSWQAVQKNIGSAPRSGPKKPVPAESPSEPPSGTAAQVNTAKTKANSLENPDKAISVPESGKTEKTADDSGVAPVSPTPQAVSKPASESGDKQNLSGAPTGKREGEKTLSETGIKKGKTEVEKTDGQIQIKEEETAGQPEKKGEAGAISPSVRTESTAVSGTGNSSATAGIEGGKSNASDKLQKPGAGHGENSGSPDSKSSETGKAEKNQNSMPDAAVTESVPAVKPVSEPLAPVKEVSETETVRELMTVKSKSEKEAFEVHIMADGPVRQYKSFPLPSESPPKLVVDLPGKWKHRGQALFRVKDSMVSQVRVGLHPNFIRVVFDLKISGPVKPAFSETDQGMMVILRRNAE